MSDSAEGLEYFKPDFSRRVVPAPVDYEAESETSSSFPSVGRTAPRSDGSDTSTRRPKASKNSRRNGLPTVNTDTETDAQPRPLFRKAKFLLGWMISLLFHSASISFLAAYVLMPQPQETPLSLVVSMIQPEEEGVVDDLSVEFAMANDAEVTVDEVEVEVPEEVDLVELLDSRIGLEFAETSNLSNSFSAGPTEDDFAVVDVGKSGQGKPAGQGQGKGASKGTLFFGIESKGDRFVYVVDCSRSMIGENRYQRAVYELQKSLGRLNEDQEFLVALYSDRIYPMLGTNLKEAKLIKATVENRAKVIEWMRIQVPSGFTLPARAMYGALQLQPDAIFLLSDGELNDDTVGLLRDTNLNDSSAGTRKIPVNTVTLGSTGLGLSTMKMIANENRGKFVWVK